jgi:hypothetical protein
MARKTIVTLTDDLDGSPADETISFAFEGKSYTIDLNAKNAAKLRKAIAPFAEVASLDRSARVPRGRRHGGRGSSSGIDPKAVREWALSQGYHVSARGRVSSKVVEAYKAAGH